MSSTERADNRPAGPGWRSSTGYLAGVLAGSNILATVLRLAGGLIAARLVLPEEMGVYSGIGLVLTYAAILQFGVLSGLNRELPFWIGKGDRAQAEALAATALSWLAAWGAVACLGLLGWTALQAALGHWQEAAGGLSYSLILLMTFPDSYVQATMRTSHEFARLALVQSVGAFVGFALILLVWALGFWGLCLRGVVLAAVQLALLWRWRPVRVGPRFDRSALLRLVKVGLPIFVVGYAFSGWRSLDSAVVIKFLGAHSMGLFQVTVLTLAAGAAVTQALSQVVYPRMVQEYARTGSARHALGLAWRPVLWVAGAGLPLIALGALVLPYVVRLLLPAYADGIPAAQWSLLTVYILVFAAPLNYFNVVRKLVIYGAIIAGSCGMFLAALAILSQALDDKLVAVAVSMAVGTLGYVVVGNLVAWSLARGPGSSSPDDAPSPEDGGTP
jgi:O-antigen/teichoic acid export membrane protein